MTPHDLRALFEAVARGETTAEQAALRVHEFVQVLPFEDLGFARVDHHRALRQGFPEVIFGAGKTPAQIADIAVRLASRGQDVIVTRTTENAYEAVRAHLPDAKFHPDARMIVRRQEPLREGVGALLVAAAGTSDIPVAEEAALTAEVMGSCVERLYDVGVAGLHRLLGASAQLQRARVIVAVAGMEGALPSVIGGLVAVPVIAVPTSIGYGAHLGGLAPLLAMLNSCAVGIGVVNIDNGFGAGALAHRINALAREVPLDSLPRSR
ncbi:MAG: nickel pincer cofactor biosynthesis protein LarB [Vicinamibacterales bacterium]